MLRNTEQIATLKPLPFSIAPLKKLEGPLAINRQLDDVERLLEGRLYGPEALLPLGSDIYTGTYGGQIVRINETHISPVARLGGHCGELCLWITRLERG